MYDIDYEINKYIDEQADCYVSFHDLLKQNHLTFEEAKQRVKKVQREVLRSALKIFYQQ